ncbi:hypothetical protein RKD20_007862 [Streptomyces sp. SLBN-8D4]
MFDAGHEGFESLGDTGGQFLAVGDGVVVAEPQSCHGPVGAHGELAQVVALRGGRVGGVTNGGGAFRLECGHGVGDGRADGAVHALQLP